MKVRIQHCWGGGEKYYFRALVCGGLLLRVSEGEQWSRSIAKRMLDLIAIETGLSRASIRFIHV